MMKLGFNAGPIGGHLAGWRHPDSFPSTAMQLRNLIEVATLAEGAKFDIIFLADGNGVRQMDKPALFASNSPSDRPAVFEPVTLLSAVSQHTRHIGLVATATTTYEEPFTIARKFASLDHLSEGRAAWNLVTTQYSEESKNFGREEHLGRDERYDRARESLDVVRGLWNSWAGVAVVQDKATGRYLDPDWVRVLKHRGRHFSVKGPLNIARCPQGQSVVFMAGQSEGGKELAAYGADAMFCTANSMAAGQAAYANVKGCMAKYGRAPESLKLLPGLSVCVGRTTGEAEDLVGELNALISEQLAVTYLSKMVRFDLSSHPVDGPMPQARVEGVGGTSMGGSILDMAARENFTLRQTCERILPSMGGNLLAGDPTHVADIMEAWYRGGACDGFILSMPVLPRSLRDFVTLVVPELQRRGLFRAEYEGATLRANLSLPVPPDPFASPYAALSRPEMV